MWKEAIVALFWSTTSVFAAWRDWEIPQKTLVRIVRRDSNQTPSGYKSEAILSHLARSAPWCWIKNRRMPSWFCDVAKEGKQFLELEYPDDQMIMYGKLRIYESRVRHILTNLYEWTDTITSEQILEIAEETVLRKIMGKTNMAIWKAQTSGFGAVSTK